MIPKKKYIKKIKVCLCVIGKQENRYINEFLNHYINLGYVHIYIYDNNDLDYNRIEDIINNKKYVIIIDYIDKNKNKKVNAKFEAYYNCYKKNNRNMIDYLFLILMNFYK